jgi:hypothetical protein
MVDPFLREVRTIHAIRRSLAGLDDAERAQLLAHLTEKGVRADASDWVCSARPDQLPPEHGGWSTWALLGGRASGKTHSLSQSA